VMDAPGEVTGQPISARDRERILTLADRVRNMPIEFLPGVKDPLAALNAANRLILFTKGDFQEQRDKVDRSGATGYFDHVEVVEEPGGAVARAHELGETVLGNGSVYLVGGVAQVHRQLDLRHRPGGFGRGAGSERASRLSAPPPSAWRRPPHPPTG